MKRTLFSFGLFGIASVALAASGWYQFDGAFEPLPCQDGWMACMVDGQYVSPGMVVDGSGRPHPAQQRFGFFDFEPLPAMSSMEGLSEYPDDAVADAEPVEEPPQRRPAPAPVPTRTERADPPEERRPAPAPVPTPPPDDDYGSEPTQPTPPPPPPPEPEEVEAAPPPPPPPPSEPEEPEQKAPPPEEPEQAKTAPPPPPPPPPPVADDTCDDLIALEPAAMMGELGKGRIACLEKRLSSASSQTDKKKISLVLIADAEARQSQKDWSRFMKRHLEQIDRSDPNMCFKYAAYLSRKGPGSAYGVIRWSDYALENKQQWSGNTFKKYVYGLYRLRAQAANKLWQYNAEKYATDSSNEKAKADAELYRGKAKDYSREWLDYARASSQPTKNPMSLCVSASGNKAFCEG